MIAQPQPLIGEDVMMVKDGQPRLRADIELVCTLPPTGDRQDTITQGGAGVAIIADNTASASARCQWFCRTEPHCRVR